MSPFRIVALTLFAAFCGLFFVGFMRFRTVALVAYGVFFIDFALTYRRLKSRDEKSVAFQRSVEAKNKELPFACSNRDFATIQIIGMVAAALLFLATCWKW